MADVASQREARRRKITSNAEARMNRLLGLTTNHNQNDESPPSQNIISQGQHVEENPYNIRLRSQSSAVSAPVTSRQFTKSFSPLTSADRSSNRQSDEPIPIIHSTAVATSNTGDVGSTVQQALVGKSAAAANNTDILSQIAQGLNAQTLEILKITSFVVTAFLARFFLKFGFGILFVQSIFLPFIVLEVAFEYVIYNYLQHVPLFASKGNLMSAALMLCGMKQELVDSYNGIMARVASCISDLCLYIFSFIVWNTLIS